MNPASCIESRFSQKMFDLTFMIMLMTKFNKVSRITFLPYKFRQGLRSTLFLIFHRSQEWCSESSVVVYFLQHSSVHSCIFQNIHCIYLEIFFKKCLFLFNSGSTRLEFRSTNLLHQMFSRYSTTSPDKLCLETQTGPRISPCTHPSIYYSLTLRLLMSYIYGAPSKARNANVVYIWTYVWQR